MSDVFIIVDFNSVCRFCLESKGALSSIFDSDEENYLVLQIVEVVDIEVSPDDDMPKKVCHRCRYKIEQSFELKKMICHSQKALKEGIYDINKDFSKSLSQVADSNVDESMHSLNTYVGENNTIEDCSESQEFNEYLENKERDYINETATHRIFPNILKAGEDLQFVEANAASGNNIKIVDVVEPDNNVANVYPSIFTAHKMNKCLLCLKKYPDEESLHTHVDDHVEGTNLEPYYRCRDRNNYCKVCDQYFDYRFTFLTHQREHLDLKPFACLHSDCSAAYHTNSALKQHTMSHAEKEFMCATCGIGFKRKTDLRGHEIIHKDAGKRYRCGLCGLLCKNRLTYKHHVRKHRTQPMYKCSHCPKEYFSRSELTRHLYSHSSVKKFQCDLCSCAYFSQSALNRHVRCHDRTKLHKCPICAVVCNSWAEFVDHRKQHNCEQCPFLCAYCDKGYFVKRSLTRHMTICLKKPEIETTSVCVKAEDIQRRKLIISMIEPTDQVFENA